MSSGNDRKPERNRTGFPPNWVAVAIIVALLVVRAIGQHGRIAVVERFIQTVKVECTQRLLVSLRSATFRQDLSWFTVWYNQHRPHTTMGGRTPEEVYLPQRPANRSPRFEPRALWPRPARCALPQVLVKGQPGVRLELKVSYQHARRHLPLAAVRRAA